MVKRFSIQLAIIVGHPAMIVTGPLGGKPVETGLAIASRDFVAADAVGARLLGFYPQAVQHVIDAARLGLGQADLSQIQTKGLSKPPYRPSTLPLVPRLSSLSVPPCCRYPRKLLAPAVQLEYTAFDTQKTETPWGAKRLWSPYVICNGCGAAGR